jgi:hypothetical protein
MFIGRVVLDDCSLRRSEMLFEPAHIALLRSAYL